MLDQMDRSDANVADDKMQPAPMQNMGTVKSMIKASSTRQTTNLIVAV
jgi:hypothetical protein